MAHGDADRPLQMRVAGHRRLGIGIRAVENLNRERANCRVRLRARVADVQAQRRRDLVVARAPRVDLPPDLAELPLDRRMHVLVILARGNLAFGSNFREL